MNDLQRQLLADRLDEVCRSIDNYNKAILKLEHQLKVKKTNRALLLEQKSQLEAGVDW